jgi:flagellar basal body-associated protein FliL
MNMTDGTRSLWILMTVVLVYGYAVFLMYSMIFFATLYVILMQVCHRRQVHEDHPVV